MKTDAGRAWVKRQLVWLARQLMSSALALTSPTIFLRLVNERLPALSLRPRLLDGGLDELADVLTRIAREEKLPFADALALTIVSPDSFLSLVNDQLSQPGLRPALIDGGLNKMRQSLSAVAVQEDLPFAHFQECYSQEGEDLFLARLLADRSSGFYVDVGALHPVRFSNTYLLYKRGWSGINIDATPGSMESFKRLRPGDMNIECMISSDPSPRYYYEFEEPALNTMSEKLVRQREMEGHRVVRRLLLQPTPLAAVLENYLPAHTVIDVMSVDVEGSDLAILKSNDWDRFRPRIVIAELLGTSLENISQCEIYQFLASHDYELVAKLFNSAIFVARTAAATSS